MLMLASTSDGECNFVLLFFEREYDPSADLERVNRMSVCGSAIGTCGVGTGGYSDGMARVNENWDYSKTVHFHINNLRSVTNEDVTKTCIDFLLICTRQHFQVHSVCFATNKFTGRFTMKPPQCWEEFPEMRDYLGLEGEKDRCLGFLCVAFYDPAKHPKGLRKSIQDKVKWI